MPVPYRDIYQKCCRPLEPIPTGETPVLPRLTGIRAVLFDLYGTLFISATGEVGTARKLASVSALAEALAATGNRPLRAVDQGVACLFDAIEASHAASREVGIHYPEVDIVEIWRTVVAELGCRGVLEDRAWETGQLERLAVEYEARTNSVWPMPGLEACLGRLSKGGILLGIVSNAQFYTHELFSALLGQPAEHWGFDPELQYYSYQHGRAKPGPDLHQMAARALGRRGVEPGETLYVGNDMLNDIYAAHQVGFRTALFAGDARSLQLRPGEPRLVGVSPELVLTGLAELSECILI
ncbi:MAG: HAD family hydrolase [Planctomycetes bacterium]|nr:HAD family hydrolase [Planctomycetota bacterium]